MVKNLPFNRPVFFFERKAKKTKQKQNKKLNGSFQDRNELVIFQHKASFFRLGSREFNGSARNHLWFFFFRRLVCHEHVGVIGLEREKIKKDSNE
jgi:hypothetical protein